MEVHSVYSAVGRFEVLSRKDQDELLRKLVLFRKELKELLLKEPYFLGRVSSDCRRAIEGEAHIYDLFEVSEVNETRELLREKFLLLSKELLFGNVEKASQVAMELPIVPGRLEQYVAEIERKGERLKKVEREIEKIRKELPRANGHGPILRKRLSLLFHEREVLRKFFSRINPETIKRAVSLRREIKRIRDELINTNLRLVVSIAKRYIRGCRGLEFEDLVQEGTQGLMKALDKFDLSHNTKFATYATWWVRQSIKKAIADKSRVVRIPTHLLEVIYKVAEANEILFQRLGREPTAEEIAREISVPLPRVELALKHFNGELSLDHQIGNDEDGDTFMDMLPDNRPSPEEIAVKSVFVEQVRKLIDALPEQERLVLTYRYGLDGVLRTRTLEEVAQMIGVSRETVRTLEMKALAKLRQNRALMNRAREIM